MIYGPISPIYPTKSQTQLPTQGITSSINDPNFMRLLIAQMRNPDMSSLFTSSEEEDSSSPFGSTFSSMFGTSSPQSTLQQLTGSQATGIMGGFGATPTLSGITPQMELSIWSGLIGKTIKALEFTSGKEINGAIKSVLLDNGVVKLEVNGTYVAPGSLEKIEIK